MAAAAGLATALVECDVERPRLAAELGLAPTPGLHEYLRWEATPAEIAAAAGPGRLGGRGRGGAAGLRRRRPAGRASAATLLGLRSFRHMTAKLRDAYELVVLARAAAGRARGGSLATPPPRPRRVLAGARPEQRVRPAAPALAAALSRLPADRASAPWSSATGSG